MMILKRVLQKLWPVVPAPKPTLSLGWNLIELMLRYWSSGITQESGSNGNSTHLAAWGADSATAARNSALTARAWRQVFTMQVPGMTGIEQETSAITVPVQHFRGPIQAQHFGISQLHCGLHFILLGFEYRRPGPECVRFNLLGG